MSSGSRRHHLRSSPPAGSVSSNTATARQYTCVAWQQQQASTHLVRNTPHSPPGSASPAPRPLPPQTGPACRRRGPQTCGTQRRVWEGGSEHKAYSRAPRDGRPTTAALSLRDASYTRLFAAFWLSGVRGFSDAWEAEHSHSQPRHCASSELGLPRGTGWAGAVLHATSSQCSSGGGGASGGGAAGPNRRDQMWA